MVALPVITDVHRVAFKWRVGSSGPTAVNVMHFRGPSAIPTGLYTALGTNLTAAMWAGIGTDTKIYEVDITPLDGVTATLVNTPTGAQWAGSSTPGNYMPDAAGVISLRTASRGRRYRGRIYTPFILESVAANGIFTAPLTATQAAWNTFLAAMNTATWGLVVATYGHSLHRTKNPGGGYTLTPVTWTPDATPVTSLNYELTLGTQRRRQQRLRV